MEKYKQKKEFTFVSYRVLYGNMFLDVPSLQ